MTQKRLAEKVHVSTRDLSTIERGERQPSPRTAQALSDYFGVRPEALFPQGVREAYTSRSRGRVGAASEKPYRTPKPRKRRFPREFYVLCWKCRSRIYLAATGERTLMHEQLTCPACGAPFDVAESSQEARP
jgi:transcriptional regulator with XRE-family HTH domain